MGDDPRRSTRNRSFLVIRLNSSIFSPLVSPPLFIIRESVRTRVERASEELNRATFPRITIFHIACVVLDTYRG